MDQKKTGAFLKRLRKEKGLTQEQLAEKFNVSGRSVSRWETGNNMPDLSMLLEIADFYDVDIREIIDGERKTENMNADIEETVLKVADYTDTVNQILAKKMRWLSIIGLLGIIIFIILESTGLSSMSFIYEDISSGALGLAFGIMAVNVMYQTGLLAKIKKRKMQRRQNKAE